jgi:hypothetical protein
MWPDMVQLVMYIEIPSITGYKINEEFNGVPELFINSIEMAIRIPFLH